MSAHEAVASPEPAPTRTDRLDGLVEQLAGSAGDAVWSTYAALDRSVTTITEDCRAIGETLSSLDDALGVIEQSGDGQAWSGFGLVGLPIMGVLRAVKGMAGQYVKQETGVSLHDWTDLVATAAQRFAGYVELLEKLPARMQRHLDGEDSELGAEDLGLLLDIRWHTQVWKQVLSRVGKLGHLLDAILKVDLGQVADAEPGADESAGFSGALKRFKDTAQSRVMDRSGDLQDWVLRPFVELRDRVQALPREVEAVAREVVLLEMLLELAIAQLRARQGELSEAAARLVRLRVAAAVVLPELARDLSDAKGRAAELAATLERLGAAREAGQVGEEVHAVLSAEYQQALTACQARLADLQARADIWRRDGSSILDSCVHGAQLELDVLAARGLVEQGATRDQRHEILERELERLQETRALLGTL